MSILITCPYCSNQAAVAEEHAGQSVQCPHCGGVMQVDLPAAEEGYYPPQYADPDPTPPSFAPGFAPSPPHGGWPQGPASAAAATFTCARCRGVFVADEAADVGGATVCQTCAPPWKARRRRPRPPTPAQRPPASPSPRPAASKPAPSRPSSAKSPAPRRAARPRRPATGPARAPAGWRSTSGATVAAGRSSRRR